MCAGPVGLGAQPGMYFGKETVLGSQTTPLCPSLSALTLVPSCARRVSCASRWTPSSVLPSSKSGLADGPLLAPGASYSLKEPAEEARFYAKPLESSLASIIKENDAIGKICWEQ